MSCLPRSQHSTSNPSIVSLLLYYVSFLKFGKKNIRYLALTMLLMVGIALEAMIVNSGGYASPYYSGINLLILVMSLLLAWRVREALMGSAALYAIYLFPTLKYDHITDFGIFFNNPF